jgi:hypothetical protein
MKKPQTTDWRAVREKTPGQSLRVVHFLKPPALPGDTYYTLMGRTAVDLRCHGFTANNRKVGKHFARTSTGQPNLHILGSRFSTAAIE